MLKFYKVTQAQGLLPVFIDGEGEANTIFHGRHYATRFAEEGLDTSDVEAAVAPEVNATLSSASKVTVVGRFSRRIMVNDVHF